MKVNSKRKVFFLLSLMITQSLYVRATLQKCLFGCSHSDVEECNASSDTCLAGDICSRFEIQRVTDSSDDSAVDSLAVQKCMGKDKCDENKGKDNLSLITEVERTINFWGFKNAEGEVKFACCNFGSDCNSNDIAQMKVEQEKFEKGEEDQEEEDQEEGDKEGAADSSAKQTSSKVHFVFLMAFGSLVF